MNKRKNVPAICGSTRKASANLTLLKSVAELTKDTLDIRQFEGLSAIPHFNPDLDNETPPHQVTAFRRIIEEADGVFICTPEYAMGVPGTLNNAIGWLVSTAGLSHKPVAFVTASSQGYEGHASLLKTLRIVEGAITDEMQSVIPFIKTKISNDKITDTKALDLLKCVLAGFIKAMDDVNTGGD